MKHLATQRAIQTGAQNIQHALLLTGQVQILQIVAVVQKIAQQLPMVFSQSQSVQVYMLLRKL